MNAFDLARTAYSDQSAPVRTARSMEYEAFARVTRRIRAAAQDAAEFPQLVRALHENRRLWTLLAAHVADDANQLPTELRARIFYLAEFTSVTTSKILRRDMGPEVLVDINMAVMRGLNAQEAAP